MKVINCDEVDANLSSPMKGECQNCCAKINAVFIELTHVKDSYDGDRHVARCPKCGVIVYFSSGIHE